MGLYRTATAANAPTVMCPGLVRLPSIICQRDGDSMRPATGATYFDLRAMTAGDFERMCGRLVRLEFPAAFTPSEKKDGGADAVLPDAAGGYERCWQAKHYPNGIDWRHWEKSLETALENWSGLSRFTFCCPRELTVTEQKTFDKKFRAKGTPVTVDVWNGEELQARLLGSDEGLRVARTFFDDTKFEREQTLRIVGAGGPLETTEDVFDRLDVVGGALGTKDAFFRFPLASHETGTEGPGMSPGSVMSVLSIDPEGLTNRVDVVPRDDNALELYGPEFVLKAEDTEEGREAAERLNQALAEGTPVDIAGGLTLTFTQLPPGLSDLTGKPLTGGRFILAEPEPVRSRKPIPDWLATLTASTDRDEAAVDIDLRQTTEVPEGWDDAMDGQHGGLTATALFRNRDGRGGLNWNFRHQRDDSPAREQLASLRFLDALSGNGTLTITDRKPSGRPPLTVPTKSQPVEPRNQWLHQLLADVVAVEEWSGTGLPLPKQLTQADLYAITAGARMVRAGEWAIGWQHLALSAPAASEAALRSGRTLRYEQLLGIQVFGRRVDLGYAQVDITNYTLVSVERNDDDTDLVAYRIEPKDSGEARLVERLVKAPTPAHPLSSPPPPAPKKAARQRAKSKKRKRKR